MWANNVGYAILSRGQPRRALRFFLEAAEVFEEQDPVGSMFHALCLGAMAASIIGDRQTTHDLLRRHGEHLTVRGQSFGRVLRARAATWQHFAEGDLRTAADAAVEAGRVGVEGDQHIHAMAAFHDAVRIGYGSLVAEHLDKLTTQINGDFVVAMATHAKAAAEDDGDALADVAGQFSLMGADLLAAEALAQASHCYREHGRHASATQTAVRATELLKHCDGAVTPWLWLERPQALTPRQLEVARLAASGLTDREISDRLELSVRTVSNHLASAYVKLGINDRRELEGLVSPTAE